MQAAPAENFCEYVARGGDSLSGRASDTESEGLLHRTLSYECRPFHCSPALGRAQFKVRFPVSETPPSFRVAGVYTQNFRIFPPAGDLGSTAEARLAGSVKGQKSHRKELRSRQIVRASAKLEAVFVGLQGAHSPP